MAGPIFKKKKKKAIKDSLAEKNVEGWVWYNPFLTQFNAQICCGNLEGWELSCLLKQQITTERVKGEEPRAMG